MRNLLLGMKEVVVQGRRSVEAVAEERASALGMASGNGMRTAESRCLAEEPNTWVRHDQRQDMLVVVVVVALATWKAGQVRKVVEAKTASDLATTERMMA
jgi:hypothetical protein